MNYFDIIYLLLLSIFFIRGWMKGFFHSIIGPICLGFWFIIGIMNYDLTENAIEAIMITLIGSFCSTLTIHFALFLGQRTVQKEHRRYVFIGSKILGGILNTGWNGLLTAFVAIALTLMPMNFMGLHLAQETIQNSHFYGQFYQHLIRPFPVIRNVSITISVFKNYQILTKYKDSYEYNQVFSHPNIQAVIENPELMEKLYSQDAFFLINDPAIRRILEDENLIFQISNLGKLIYTDQAAAQQQQ